LNQGVDDLEVLYRAVSSRDRRFDGRFVFAVTTTGIYCRPSCPARTPRPENVRYFPIPAAAVAAGFRACQRCRPDTFPRRRTTNHDQDLAERALRYVADGVVDEEGVSGLALRLSLSERQLHRTLASELGVGALALAQSRRAQTARLLLEQTALPVTQVAFSAGFGSLRQFNDVMRAEFGRTPSQLRRAPVAPDRPARSGPLRLHLHTRLPWDGHATIAFLGARVIRGVEVVGPDGSYTRSIATPGGAAVLTARPTSGASPRLSVSLSLATLTDVSAAVAATRRLFDLDADPQAISADLSSDPKLAPLVASRSGLRVPGCTDGFELAVRAVVGQQISVPGAATLLARLAALVARPAPEVEHRALRWQFPRPSDVEGLDLTAIGLTTRRTRTIQELAAAMGEGLDLHPGSDHDEQRRRLLTIAGIGPWTTEYIAMRALADVDAFPATDLVLRREVARRGLDPQRWRPWRAYAAMQLWAASGSLPKTQRKPQKEKR